MKYAWLILHTGKPYLKYAVEAIYDQVDRIGIAYTPNPSQSWPTDLECPDTKEELLEEIKPFMDKIDWREGMWSHENEHCDAARAMGEGYEWLIRFDADEIYQPGSVDEYIKSAEKSEFKEWRIPFVHFWRCFDKVCRDQSHPVRLERRSGDGLGWIEGQEVLHFGYAMPTNYIKYKMAVSGHHSEWRPTWFQEKWLANAQEDIHPVMFRPSFWHTEDYDKTTLPEIMKKHPYYNYEII